jgi:hypothetical protein
VIRREAEGGAKAKTAATTAGPVRAGELCPPLTTPFYEFSWRKRTPSPGVRMKCPQRSRSELRLKGRVNDEDFTPPIVGSSGTPRSGRSRALTFHKLVDKDTFLSSHHKRGSPRLRPSEAGRSPVTKGEDDAASSGRRQRPRRRRRVIWCTSICS